MFERMMQVHVVEEARWALRLAPQLTGKVQQAYAAMSAEGATDYQQVKIAILRWYNISKETHHRRFRMARKKDGETLCEMVIRLYDLVRKWMAECETAEAVLETIVTEQLINTMPAEMRIWVSGRKPKMGGEAGGFAETRCREWLDTTGSLYHIIQHLPTYRI